MYTQFFGNYLLSKGCLTTEQLFSAMQKQANAHMRLGTLAIHSGFMTAAEVDQVVAQQSRQDKKFGELAIEMGYLTDGQVVSLLKTQSPDFLLLGQVLVDDGVLTNTDLETLISDYRAQNELNDLDMTHDSHENVSKILNNFFIMSETPLSHNGHMYLELLFNDFIRFIGEDFTPLASKECKEFEISHCIHQDVHGDYAVNAYINMDTATAVEFASRYAGEQFVEYDEYVQASLEDFLNVHNGLFIVNVSNDSSTELTISAPQTLTGSVIKFENRTYHFPMMYSFGTIDFLLEVIKTN